MITPALQAALDQEDAELSQHLDVLIELYRRMCADSGNESQSASNLVAFVPTRYTPIAASGLLMTAIRRLTAEGTQP